MGAIKLELPCTKNTTGNNNGIIITADPEPNWNLDSLLSELNSLQLKLNGTSSSSTSYLIVPFTKKQAHSNKKVVNRSSQRQRGFVMRVSDDDDDDDREDVVNDTQLVTRFSFTDSSDSESSGDDDSVIEENQMQLMGRVGLLDGVLAELEHERHQGITEKVRNRVKTLETDLMHVYERSASALSKVEKDRDYRREQNCKLDMRHCRAIAENRENHLLTVQRDHEHRSQIEERKIQNAAAAFEEARRKEQTFHEEKMRQEKAKAETEAAKKRAEEARKAATLEAEKNRIAKEAAEKQVAENAKGANEEAQKREAAESIKDVNRSEPVKSGSNNAPSAGSLVRAADSALRVEVERLQKFREVDAKNQAFRLSSNQDFRSHELQIGRRIKQISGNRDSVSAKATELIKLINDPQCPQSISAAMFAKKVVSQCSTQSANFNSTAFACGHVIVLVTSQVPLAMDLLLAELHKACIYTVPKHVVYSKSAISKEDYFKVIGFREEDGKVESLESFLEGVASYMKLYGALVQTEVSGVQNLHGLKEGWAWVARLLNSLPAHLYTAVALNSFLEMAGFALFKTYKTQFRKVLNYISRHFLGALESKQDPKLNPIIIKLKTYIDTNQFLKQPEGWLLKTSLLSEMAMPEANYSPQQNYHSQQNYHAQQNYYPQQNRQYRNY